MWIEIVLNCLFRCWGVEGRLDWLYGKYLVASGGLVQSLVVGVHEGRSKCLMSIELTLIHQHLVIIHRNVPAGAVDPSISHAFFHVSLLEAVFHHVTLSFKFISSTATLQSVITLTTAITSLREHCVYTGLYIDCWRVRLQIRVRLVLVRWIVRSLCSELGIQGDLEWVGCVCHLLVGRYISWSIVVTSITYGCGCI